MTINLKNFSHGKSRQYIQQNINLQSLSLLRWLELLQVLYVEISVIVHQLYDPLLFL